MHLSIYQKQSNVKSLMAKKK